MWIISLPAGSPGADAVYFGGAATADARILRYLASGTVPLYIMNHALEIEIRYSMHCSVPLKVSSGVWGIGTQGTGQWHVFDRRNDSGWFESDHRIDRMGQKRKKGMLTNEEFDAIRGNTG